MPVLSCWIATKTPPHQKTQEEPLLSRNLEQPLDHICAKVARSTKSKKSLKRAKGMGQQKAMAHDGIQTPFGRPMFGLPDGHATLDCAKDASVGEDMS